MNTKKDPRFKQANREALLAFMVYGLYFIWWYVFGFGMGEGSPDEYTYIMGFPAWFFYSCIIGYPVITILLWAIVRFKFKEMPLDSEVPDDELNRIPGQTAGGDK